MSQITASAILAVAIVAAAWLLKPLATLRENPSSGPGCWVAVQNHAPTGNSFLNTCTGEEWTWVENTSHWAKTFGPVSRGPQ